MPYIQKVDRKRIETKVKLASKLVNIGKLCKNCGELNYAITKIIRGYLQENGGRYQQINDILGALEGAKLEFYRRIVSPYEDKKIIENGDV
jgi:hypothetical protein